MAYDRTCPTPSRNSHLQLQVDSQEFRGKGVQNVGKGGGGRVYGEGKVGDMCGPTWGPCVTVLARLGACAGELVGCKAGNGKSSQYCWNKEPECQVLLFSAFHAKNSRYNTEFRD